VAAELRELKVLRAGYVGYFRFQVLNPEAAALEFLPNSSSPARISPRRLYLHQAVLRIEISKRVREKYRPS
jgi:hypothetical protein